MRINTKIIIKRNIVFMAHSFVMSAIQFYLPLGVLHTLGTVGPISVSLYQYFLDHKSQNCKQILGIVVTVLGIIFTANGRLIS